MQKKDCLIVALAPVPVLMIPLAGVLFSDWQWGFGSFVAAWILLASATFVYRLIVTRPAATLSYRLGVGVAVATSFALAFINLAVGIIGSEDNPANALYFLVILMGLAGVGLSRFRAAGLANAAFAMAAGTFIVPVIAFAVNRTDFSPGVMMVFVLNGGFVALFIVAGLLLRHAAGQASRRSAVPQAG